MTEIVEYHTYLTGQTFSLLERMFGPTVTEYRLPNGRIADLLTIHNHDTIIITEVKTYATNSLITGAIMKYAPYCDKLFIAAPALSIETSVIAGHFLDLSSDACKVGLIAVNGMSTFIYKDAPTHRMVRQTSEYILTRLREHPHIARTSPGQR